MKGRYINITEYDRLSVFYSLKLIIKKLNNLELCLRSHDLTIFNHFLALFLYTLDDSCSLATERNTTRRSEGKKVSRISRFLHLDAIRSALKGIITHAGSLRLVISRGLPVERLKRKRSFLGLCRRRFSRRLVGYVESLMDFDARNI